MRVMTSLMGLQAMLMALVVSTTQAIHVAVVVSWGTRTHATPLFDGLRPLVRSSPNHRVTFVSSAFSASFASNHLDVVQVENTGIVHDEKITRDFHRTASQTDKPVVTTDEFIRILGAIGERYEDSLEVYIPLFQSRKFDLIICDFFDRACMDAALESGTTYAISGPLGMAGAGDAWFVPDVMFPVPMETWIRSPLVRARAFWDALPVIRFSLNEETRTKAVRDKLGFRTSSTYMAHFQQNLFLCANVIGIDPARAIPPNIVLVGSSIDEKSIPQLQPEMKAQLQQFEIENVSVAYIAFGTAVSLADSLTVYTKMARGIDKLLSQQPKMAVIWSSKYHDAAAIATIQAKHPRRLLTAMWVEQRRLLLHDSVKVFMSHGGYGSLTEALFAGKPLVIMPFFGDQFINAHNAVDMGVAVQLNRLTFTSEEMASALTTAMEDYNDPGMSLAQHTTRMKTIVRLNSEMGRSLLTNTVLMAATAGTSHLVPRDVHLSIFDRFPLWLIGGVLGVLLALYTAGRSLLTAIYRLLQRSSSKSKQT